MSVSATGTSFPGLPYLVRHMPVAVAPEHRLFRSIPLEKPLGWGEEESPDINFILRAQETRSSLGSLNSQALKAAT